MTKNHFSTIYSVNVSIPYNPSRVIDRKKGEREVKGDADMLRLHTLNESGPLGSWTLMSFCAYRILEAVKKNYIV